MQDVEIWKESLLRRGLEKASIEEIQNILIATCQYVEEDRLDLLNSIFEIDPYLLHNQTNNALLRASFVFKYELPNWIIFRDKVVEVVTSRGDDVGTWMIGLKKSDEQYWREVGY